MMKIIYSNPAGDLSRTPLSIAVDPDDSAAPDVQATGAPVPKLQKTFDGFFVRNENQRSPAELAVEWQEEEVLCALARLGEQYMEGRTGRSERIAALAYRLALAAGMGDNDARQLRRAARFLDVGFIAVPHTVLTKQGPLTEYEREEINRHAQAGACILSRFSSPLAQTARLIAAHHHERWNGSGYPNGLVDESIPLSARIVAIADVFDALIRQRADRDAFAVDDALAQIVEGAGTLFDPKLVELFAGLVEQEKAITGGFAAASKLG